MSQDGNISITKEELEEMLQRELRKSLVVKNYSYKLANEKGKNFGSLLFSIVVSINYTENGVSDTLNILAKVAPPTEFLKAEFNFPFTFCKEMNFYKLVNPAYANFEKTKGVPGNHLLDIIPPFFGARTSLTRDDDELADDTTAVLMMGDLRKVGYRVADQSKGLDFNHCKLALTKLAEFHAIPIAMRQKEPDVYKETVMKAAKFKVNAEFASAREQIRKDFQELMEKHNPNLNSYFIQIRNKLLENSLNFCPENKEPFSTVVHNDLWTNNMLFCYTDKNNSNSPTDVKFIDFQGTIVCSPIKDVIFFLYSSAKDYVLEMEFDNLLNVYYDRLINKLEQLQCDTQKFSKEKFHEEIATFAPTQFFHILFMLTVIYADQSNAQDIHNCTSFENIMSSWNVLSKRKLERTVLSFSKKGWL